MYLDVGDVLAKDFVIIAIVQTSSMMFSCYLKFGNLVLF